MKHLSIWQLIKLSISKNKSRTGRRSHRMEQDFGCFGSGLTGYAQYKTAFDRNMGAAQNGKADYRANKPSDPKASRPSSESAAKAWRAIFLLYAAAGSLVWRLENQNECGYGAAVLLEIPCIGALLANRNKKEQAQQIKCAVGHAAKLCPAALFALLLQAGCLSRR